MPNAAGLEQRQRPPLVAHHVVRRIHEEIVGPQTVEDRKVPGEERGAILLLACPDILFPGPAHRSLL